ncbi:MAG: deoxyribodipyrimidine photo-lyase [Acidobacteriota bacterium]
MNQRVKCLKDVAVPKGSQYVLYWMQMSKRSEYNHALRFAAEQANSLKLPLVVYEGLKYYYPYACDRIHRFILENSVELQRRFKEKGICYLFRLERNRRERAPTVLQLCSNAALLVSDDFPAFIVPRHNQRVRARIGIPFFVVDSSGIVPLATFNKQEYAARTIRPKIRALLPKLLTSFDEVPVERDSVGFKLDFQNTPLSSQKIEELTAACDINHGIKSSPTFRGGCCDARDKLRIFIENKLDRYASDRNLPSVDGTSNLSPYLHFGMISALEVALAVKSSGKRAESVEAYLEELIVRRELSFNFTKFNPDYESISGLPNWVQKNLARHERDRRVRTYTLEQFEAALTHDPIWNACQHELLRNGKIHGYMRMYWGKKIIEWSRTYAEALETMIYLNNQYALDGRDPNSWTGILWCFGLHDRPWRERPVFGTIRYMSGERLRRKVDVDGYVRRNSWG